MKVDFESQDIILELSPEGQDGKSVRPLGEWSATEEYHALDLVTYQGESYIALKDVPEGVLPTDTEYWMINASNKTVYWGTIEGTLADQTDLATALADKADANTVYTKTETDSLLADKADADDVYTKTETDSLLADKADADAVYTKAEADNLLNAKADADDVYTKAETDNLLDAKADATDVYSKAETDGLLNDKADADSVYTKTEADALLAEKADSDDVYTKAETDNLLSAKANTADLGDLAEKDTVDYQTEVTNKPTLGSLSSLDSISYESNYLTDKPVLGTMSAEDDAPSDDAQYVRKNGAWEDLAPTLNDKADAIKSTVSGSLVHLTDAAAMPVDALTVGIEPVQGGSGTPSPDNVRPISGHSTATVTRTGKNLLKMNVTYMPEQRGATASYSESTGASYTGTFSGSGRGAPIQIEDVVIPAGTYTFSSENTAKIRVLFIDSNSNMIASIAKNTKSSTVTLSQPRTISRISLDGILGDETNFTLGHIQIEYGSTATAYEPYQGQTVTINLNGTYYGGTVDVKTGVMTVDRQLDKIKDLNWDYNSNVPNRFYSNTLRTIIKLPTTAVERAAFVKSDIYHSSNDVISQYTNPNVNNAIATYSDGYIYIIDRNYTSASDFKTARGEVQICYLLAEPFTVQLTPAELSLLYGTNNVWADTGDTTVGYRADTRLFIERLTQPTEDDMTANVNIASGKYFMVGNSLYLSTASIASGETIAPGTNCTALSLADALNNLS